MIGTPKKGDNVPFNANNAFNAKMMVLFLLVIVRERNTNREKYAFYCSVSQIHIITS